MVRVEVKAGDLGLKNQEQEGKWCMMGSGAEQQGEEAESGKVEPQLCSRSVVTVRAAFSMWLLWCSSSSSRASGAAPAPWSGVWQHAGEERGFDFSQCGVPPAHSAAVCFAPEFTSY